VCLPAHALSIFHVSTSREDRPRLGAISWPVPSQLTAVQLDSSRTLSVRSSVGLLFRCATAIAAAVASFTPLVFLLPGARKDLVVYTFEITNTVRNFVECLPSFPAHLSFLDGRKCFAARRCNIDVRRLANGPSCVL